MDTNHSPLPPALIEAFTALLGASAVVTEADALEPYLEEPRGRYHGAATCVVRPGNTQEVAELVKLCTSHGVPIVPQGGNTGLVGGSVSEAGTVILSLGRMNKMRALDNLNNTITVEAGCILSQVQTWAEEADLLFPLSLAAEGSCQIGGNLATNAGGINVLRYGNARDLALGLEVVLPDGRIWNGLRGLRKDNRGYDLKNLFIGGEGTLGIITAAVLKLFPPARARETALIALPDLDAAGTLLTLARRAAGESLSAFELIADVGLQFAVKHVDGLSDPFEDSHPWYVLMEITAPGNAPALRQTMETLLEGAFEDGVVTDAVLAESGTQTETLWRLRESISDVQKFEGGSIKHDIAVPVSLVTQFIDKASAEITAVMPGVRICAFGHMGDGNIHFNVSQPLGMDKDAYLDHWEEFATIVHDIVAEMDGSFSAEHGVGQMKVADLVHYKSAVEIDLMRTVKRALDPKNLMNPGKVILPDG
ncbi:MAG: FAD-binding oxidoreductase [Magnetospiraceae bacterium]